MGYKELSKTVTMGLTAGSDIVDLPREAIQEIGLFFSYTVTDVGISSGENIQGWMKSLKIKGDKLELMRVDRNEWQSALALLAQGKMVPGVDYDDPDPTTAELQGAYYRFPLAHDLSQYKSAQLLLEWGAATDEWGAASAMSATCTVIVKTGVVRESIILDRQTASSGTSPEISTNDYPITQFMLLGGAGYITEVELKGKDGYSDVHMTVPLAGSAYYAELLHAAKTDDVVTTLATPRVLVDPYAERKVKVKLSTAEALTMFALCVKATHVPTRGYVGDKDRGKGKVITTDLATGIATSKA